MWLSGDFSIFAFFSKTIFNILHLKLHEIYDPNSDYNYLRLSESLLVDLLISITFHKTQFQYTCITA